MFSILASSLRDLASTGPVTPVTPGKFWDANFLSRESIEAMVNAMVSSVMGSGKKAGSKVSLVEGDVTTTLMATPGGFQILVTKGESCHVNGPFPSAVLYHPTSLTIGYGTGSDPFESRVYWGSESTVVEAPGLRAVFKGHTLHIWSSGADGRFEFEMDASGDDVKYRRVAEFCIARTA